MIYNESMYEQSGEKDYILEIGSISVEDQINITKTINNKILEKDIFSYYINIARRAEEDFIVNEEEFHKLTKGLEFNGQYGFNSDNFDIYSAIDDNYELLISYDNEDSLLTSVAIMPTKTDTEDSISLFTTSKVYTSHSSENLQSTCKVSIATNTYEEQNDILDKIKDKSIKSQPALHKRELTEELVKTLREKNKYFKMSEVSEISYSSEINPKEKTMKQSIDYIKEYTGGELKEVSKTYEDEVGVTEVIYNCNEKRYIVRYMHPYSEGNPNVYDLDKTLGIYVYKDIL